MTKEEVEILLQKLGSTTDYLYLHVKGEPLLHPQLKEILELANQYGKKVNITTNGTLLKEKEEILWNSPAIRQINLSLHSENQKETYLEDIFSSVERLSQKYSIVYRFWTLKNGNFDKKSTEMVEKIIQEYHLSTEMVNKIKRESNVKIKNNLYLNKANLFLWPDIHNSYQNEIGYCHALKDQIAILVDGTVVPCCLDGEGVLNLGNLLTGTLEEILKNPKIEQMKKGFQNRKVSEELCKHCNFKEKFDRKKN